MRAALFALLAVAALATPATGKDAFTRGIGARRCATFLRDVAAHPAAANLGYVTWAEGYMSGMNVATAAAGAGYHNLGAVAGGMKADLRRYCRAHRKAPFTDAIMAIYLKQQHKRYALE